MTDFDKSQTKKNLARAFAGECQAGARYQFLAQNCKNDELIFLQNTLKILAKNEMSHAKVFYNHITDLCGGTQQNIEITAGFPFPCCDYKTGFGLAAKNELSEHKNIYPTFAKIALDEGYRDVANSFNLIAGVENCHYKLLTEIQEKIDSGKLYKTAKETKWKCSQCGYEDVAKQAPKICPLCQAKQGYNMVPLSDE